MFSTSGLGTTEAIWDSFVALVQSGENLNKNIDLLRAIYQFGEERSVL